MSCSLYSAIIPSWVRILNAGLGWLEKAEEFAKEKGISEEELLNARLIDDMLPLAYQVKSMKVHSKGAIEGLRAGEFSPDMTPPPSTLADLKAMLSDAISFVQALDASEIDAMMGKNMAFTVPQAGKRLDFTAEDFLFSFSQANFYFHAVTAYDVLRNLGVPVGKIDFLGALPVKM